MYHTFIFFAIHFEKKRKIKISKNFWLSGHEKKRIFGFIFDQYLNDGS
uniref:Uncharacterized protein n=1 Tax=Pithovirus LCPAC304 TaxID=2506594 RepID=A0A481Z8N4_9VIRU|nr:MAG: hypothetical protein LCPAC304_05910 [Pithovirus LCPAC304]